TKKDKPLSYIETHAGRALYDLDDGASKKTGEAAQGIEKTVQWFGADHPYARALAAIRDTHGPQAYPGSPLLAAQLLRPTDTIHLAELHPGEFSALDLAMSPYPAKCTQQDGFDLAHTLTPPTPRRGVMLIDPSYEIKSDYEDIPRHVAKITRAWNVGIVALWYPILTSNAHADMLRHLSAQNPDALRHEVRFAPARPRHGMVGSGMFVTNPPYGMADAAKWLDGKFDKLK
ncbi:MAG: 23S rRNA (adenine(2030)-N(6))-methyltransferase RlmJ, partial [Sulfitobacter sp.]